MMAQSSSVSSSVVVVLTACPPLALVKEGPTRRMNATTPVAVVFSGKSYRGYCCCCCCCYHYYSHCARRTVCVRGLACTHARAQNAHTQDTQRGRHTRAPTHKKRKDRHARFIYRFNLTDRHRWKTHNSHSGPSVCLSLAGSVRARGGQAHELLDKVVDDQLDRHNHPHVQQAGALWCVCVYI